jgi:serine/threonine protein phosphatase PrpC
MRFSIYQESRQGSRHSNQDRVGHVYSPESVMIVVCDGMGGHANGEIAAQFVLEYMALAFRQHAKPKILEPRSFLRTMIQAAHDALIEYASVNKMSDVPRTTCVVSIIQGGGLWWANVGDSRALHVRDMQLVARTEDHSYVQTLINRGDITEAQSLTHPERHKIYNCIGQPVPPRIDLSKEMRLVPGDVVLLCTDGLWGPIPSELIATTLSRADVSVSLAQLLDLSEACSGRECDNLSAVAFGFLEGMPATPIDRDSIYVVADSRTIFDIDVDVAVRMIRAAIHHEVQR